MSKQNKLDKLFDLFLDDLLSRLESNGDERATAAELAVIAKFLRDNKVEFTPEHPVANKLSRILADYESNEDMAEEQL
jgi:hypothetical protein